MNRLRRFAITSLLVAVAATALGCAQETAKTKTETDGTLTAALWDLAAGAETARDYEKAASYYDRLQERLPNNEQALVGYLRNLRYLGLTKDAVKAAHIGIEKHGESADLMMELGKSQLAASMVNDARETFKKILAKHSDRWDAHSATGIILDRLGLHAEAQKAYATALKLSPDNTAVRNNLAMSLAQAHKLDEAIEVLRKVVEGENATPQSRQNLAMLYGLKGEIDKAEVLAQQDLPPDLVAANMAAFRKLHGRPEPAPKVAAARAGARSQAVKAAPTAAMSSAAKPPARALDTTAAVPRPSNAETAGKPRVVTTRPATAPRPPSHPTYLSNGAANVRRGPSTESPAVAFLKKDDKVQLIGKAANGNWLLIRLADGRQGYVYHKLLRRK